MPAWLDLDQVAARLGRLPIWRPLAWLAHRLGPAWVKPIRLEPPPPSPEPTALDRFMTCPPAGLHAGAAAVEITPPRPDGVFLAGFDANRTCLGVQDPIFGRALFLSDGTRPLVILTLDLIGLSLPRTRRLRQRLTREHQAAVLIACTHNHQGPDTLGLWGKSLLGFLPYRSGLDPAYLDWLEERLALCVSRAVEGARPARLGLASAAFDPAGRWVHNERSPVLDRELRVLHLGDPEGRTIATLAQHACHPETLWKANRMISADFCGVCCRVLEQDLGGVGMYANGALGAMVSASIGWETPEAERQRTLVGLGEALGHSAVRLAGAARRRPVADPRICLAHRTVSFPRAGNPVYDLLHALGVVEERDLDNGLCSEVSVVRLGPATLVAVPGEPAPELGLGLLGRVAGKPRFLLGLVNDELGYLLPEAFFGDRRYAYEQTMSPGPGAERILGEAIEQLAGEAGAQRPAGRKTTRRKA